MDAPASTPGTTYDLFLTSDAFSISWGFKDRGVTLTPEGLSWSIGGVKLERAFADIASIRLHRVPAGRNDSIGICQISFRDGTVVNVHGCVDHGFAEDEQSARYLAFVHDLHARLTGRQDTRHIRFHAGVTEGRHTVLTVAIVAAGLLFVLLPVVLVLMAGTLHALGLAVVAIAMFWSFYKLWDKNRPRSYSPARPPEDLLS